MKMATILIIDDTPSEVALMRNAVQELGHLVITAHNGKVGAQMATQHKPNLVLLDVVMPEQDGFVTCRQIKRNAETAHIPILLVTSKNGDSDRYWGLKQGASGYLTKQFDPEQLIAAVNEFLV